MSTHARRFLFLVCFLGVVPAFAVGQPAVDKTEAKRIEKLLVQLGSGKYKERESAASQLEAIGEPVLEPLRKLADSAGDLETTRRAQRLVDRIELAVVEKPVKDGIALHEKKEYESAIPHFRLALWYADKFGDKRSKPESRFFSDVQVRIARSWRAMGEYQKAGRAYQMALGCNETRAEFDREWAEMVDQLVTGWRKTEKARLDADPALQKLTSKYPLIMLHSRRYAGGGYLQSAYSFVHQTSDHTKHRNDVQLLFGNGVRESLRVIMVSNQMNRVTDLGPISFESNVDPVKITADKKTKWVDEECKPLVGHVYLEHVKDDDGNDFHVLFLVVALDREDRYIAFVWRRLPGGMTAKQN